MELFYENKNYILYSKEKFLSEKENLFDFANIM